MRTGVGLCAAIAAAVAGAPPAAAGRQTITGRAAVPVTFELRATTGDGQAVLDLKPGDLAIRINGRPRELQALTLVELGVLPAPYASNADADAGRDVLLVVDDDSIAPGKEQSFKDAATGLLDSLSPRDRVGFMTLPRARGNMGSTSEHALVRAAIAKMAGQALATQTDADLLCRTVITLEALKSLFASLSGRTTTVVFFSAVLAPPNSEAKRIGQSSGTCEVKPDNYRDVATAASAAPLNFYVVNLLDGTAAPQTNATLAAGLENLAGVIGSDIIRVTGGARNPLARVVRDTSAFYRAAVEPDAADRDGPLRLELRTPRDGVRLRAPALIVMSRMDAKAPGAGSPREMLRVGDAFRDVGVRAAAFASRQTGGDDLKIVVLFEPSEPATLLKSAAVGLYDDKGRLARQWTADAAELARKPVMAAVTAPAGSYRIRVAVSDTAGRGGTTDEEFRAEMVRADPVKLSTMILGTPASGAFSPRLQFSRESAAVGYLEIYGAPKAAAVDVTYELKARADAPAMASAAGTVQASATGDLRIAYGGMTIDALQPGDYLLIANVAIDGKSVGRAVRTLRKVK